MPSRGKRTSSSPSTPSKPRSSGGRDATLLARLEGAFTEVELRQILVGALAGLDRAAQEALCAGLGATGATLASMLGPVSATRGAPRSAVSPQRLEQEWQALWKEWDRIIKATDDEEGPYLQNEISYTSLDLAEDKLVADLESVAVKLLPLLPSYLATPAPRSFDLTKKISSSLGKIAPNHIDYLIVNEEGATLGAATSKLVVSWIWQNDPEQKSTAKLARLGKFLTTIFEHEPCFTLDEPTLTSFLTSLKAKEREEMARWLETKREQEPWQQAFDEQWGPCAPLVASLARDE